MVCVCVPHNLRQAADKLAAKNDPEAIAMAQAARQLAQTQMRVKRMRNLKLRIATMKVLAESARERTRHVSARTHEYGKDEDDLREKRARWNGRGFMYQTKREMRNIANRAIASLRAVPYEAPRSSYTEARLNDFANATHGVAVMAGAAAAAARLVAKVDEGRRKRARFVRVRTNSCPNLHEMAALHDKYVSLPYPKKRKRFQSRKHNAAASQYGGEGNRSGVCVCARVRVRHVLGWRGRGNA